MRAALFLLIAVPSIAVAEDVYWTNKSLLADFFKTSERVTYVQVKAEELSPLLGYTPAKKTYPVFIAKTKDHVDGYAVIDEELGQHLPITFGVKILPNGQVDRLEVMVYREGYGDEIREARFRRQFTGKNASDKLDVVAISGATISSKAMSAGVRRALALVSIVASDHVTTAAR